MTAKAKRIAIFSVRTLRHGLGGMETHLEALLEILETLGFSGAIFTTSLPSGPLTEQRGGFCVHYLANTLPAVHSISWWKASRMEFLKIHSEKPFDLIISEGYAGISIVRLDSETRPPAVCWTQGFEPEHFFNKWQDVSGIVAFLKYPLIKVPENVFYTLVERDLIGKCEKIVSTASHIMRCYARYYGCPESKMTLLYNWMDPVLFRSDKASKAAARTHLGWEQNSKILLLASSLSKQKGVHLAISAVSKLREKFPDMKLIIAGTGSYFAGLKALSKASGTEEITSWLGRVDAVKMKELYAACDLFLLPTLRFEGMSLAILEAMASGLPVIVSDRGGNSEEVGDSGILIPPGNVSALEKAINELLSRPELRSELGIKARKRVEKIFSRESALQKIDRLVKSLVPD